MTNNSVIIAKLKLGFTIKGIDMDAVHGALQFYSNVLGMTKVLENGSPVGHIATDRNVAHLMVNNADALYDHLEKSGVKIIKGIRDADYGIRGFLLADPDGNRIDVGQEI